MANIQNSFKRYSSEFFAEFIGTMVLVLFGCGSAIIQGSVNITLISLSFGIAIIMMAYSVGEISGGHFNPAVTLSLIVAKKFKAAKAPLYWLAQFSGATLGAILLRLIVSGRPDYKIAINGLGSNGFGAFSPAKYSMTSVVVFEIIATAIFTLVIIGSTSSKNNRFAGLAIGLGLTAIHLVGIPISGVSVNPARSFGPAIISGGNALLQMPVFIITGIIGGLLGALVWNICFAKLSLSESITEAPLADVLKLD